MDERYLHPDAAPEDRGRGGALHLQLHAGHSAQLGHGGPVPGHQRQPQGRHQLHTAILRAVQEVQAGLAVG